MRIIQEREIVEVTQHNLCFDRPDEPGCGYAFDCDKDGNVDESKLQPAGLKNYRSCLAGELEVGEPILRSWGTYHTQPRVGECDVCGKEVHLDQFTNTCECGADYNMSGQRLADRSQWGEETGEHWSECY